MFEDLDETLKNIIQDSFIIKACQSTNRLRPYHSEVKTSSKYSMLK